MGAGVGAAVGLGVGAVVGLGVGAAVGLCVEAADGAAVGFAVGAAVWTAVGALVGCAVCVGLSVASGRSALGIPVGSSEAGAAVCCCVIGASVRTGAGSFAFEHDAKEASAMSADKASDTAFVFIFVSPSLLYKFCVRTFGEVIVLHPFELTLHAFAFAPSHWAAIAETAAALCRSV